MSLAKIPISRWRRRARVKGLVADLRAQEWKQTLQHFGYSCAYCGGPYETMDHFLPMALGGGCTVSNCVPCCEYCNFRKASWHPADPSWIDPGRLAEIVTYLGERGDQKRQRVEEAVERLVQSLHTIVTSNDDN